MADTWPVTHSRLKHDRVTVPERNCGSLGVQPRNEGTGREQQAPNTMENRGARRKRELDDSTT